MFVICSHTTTNGSLLHELSNVSVFCTSTGVLAVKRVDGVPTVFPKDSNEVSDEDNLLKVVYNMGPVDGLVWDDFDTIKARVKNEWPTLPLSADNLSSSLKAKIRSQMQARGKKPQF